MDFEKSKVLLKKISAIHDSAAAFDQKLSALERDLLLQYLRSLYECVLSDDDSIAATVKEIKSRRPIAQPMASPEIGNFAHQPEQPSYKEVNGGTPIQTATAVSTENIDPDIASLFDEIKGTDRLHKFGNTPITDIAKAMGINDRILMINDLFKGDQQAFQQVIDTLNQLPSFAEAKRHLIDGVATSNDWSSEKRRQKAIAFINLVRRRYSA